jgi:hypothetical protein
MEGVWILPAHYVNPNDCWCLKEDTHTSKRNVFHVCALYYTKTLITNKCTRRVLSSIVTHSYMFRPCWVIFRENLFVIVTPRLHLKLSENMLLTVYCVVFGGVNSLRSGPAEFTPPVHSTQSTAHSHSTVKCNFSVITTENLPEDDPAGSKHVGVCYDWW